MVKPRKNRDLNTARARPSPSRAGWGFCPTSGVVIISQLMSFHLVRRRYLAALLLLALLLQSLLPALGGAAAEASNRWIEVCASSGVKWVKLDQGSPAQQHSAADHCVLCAATGAAPEFDVQRYLTALAATTYLVPKRVDAFGVFPGHAQRSRAPPVLS